MAIPQPREGPPVPVVLTGSVPPVIDGMVLVTPLGRPNIVLEAMAPVAQILVRAVRTYLQGLVGFLLLALAARPTVESVGVVLPPGDFLELLKVAAGLALAPAVIALLQNTVEILGRLDDLFPRIRA